MIRGGIRKPFSQTYRAAVLALCSTVAATLFLPLLLNELSYTCTHHGCSYRNSGAVAAATLVTLTLSVTAGAVALRRGRSRRLGTAVFTGLGLTVLSYAVLLVVTASQTA